MTKQIVFFFLLTIPFACIDQIHVDIGEEQPKIVVDGYISNKARNHQIKITRTQKFSNYKAEPVFADSAHIVGSDGHIVRLNRYDEGIFQTESHFFASPDVAYSIRVFIEGKVIESVPEYMPDTIGIGEPSFIPSSRVEVRAVDNKLVELPGIRVGTYLPATASSRYFKWEMVPTYIWEPPLAPVGSANSRCYVTEPREFNGIYLHHDVEGNYFKDIAFLEASRKWLTRYAVYIRQFNFSKSAFSYWSKIQSQEENTGSIFDTAPSSIPGNLFNTDDPDEVVLGYFGVLHESEDQLYFNLRDMPFEYFLSNPCVELQNDPLGPPGWCGSCTAWSSDASFSKPDWWKD